MKLRKLLELQDDLRSAEIVLHNYKYLNVPKADEYDFKLRELELIVDRLLDTEIGEVESE